MSQQKTHDLYDFLRQMSAEMSAEYSRIQMRATEEPSAKAGVSAREFLSIRPQADLVQRALAADSVESGDH